MSKYICGLFDEEEFMTQLPPHRIVAYGPFDTPEEAQEKAKTLSSDPNEAVVLELIDERTIEITDEQAEQWIYEDGWTDAMDRVSEIIDEIAEKFGNARPGRYLNESSDLAEN